MLNNIEKILTSMSYRLIQKNIWMKPIGFHLFTYNEERKEWINFFKSKEESLIWESKIYNNPEEDFLLWLKYNECYTKTDYHGFDDSNFEFLTIQEQVEFL